jgi:hypothetical protein
MFRAETQIIYFQPYAARPERCAVGVLVFAAGGTVQARLAENLRKAKALDPACNIDLLRDGLLSIAADIQANPTIWHLYADGFGSIRFSKEAGVINYADERELESGILWHLNTAVNPRATFATRERLPISRLFLDLKKAFAAYGWLADMGQGLADHRIVPRYPLIIDEGITTDFALMNGTLNVYQSIDFRTNQAQRKVETQAKAFAMGIAPQVSTGAHAYAIVAGTHGEDAHKSLKTLERVAEDVYVFESSDDMTKLYNDIAVKLDRPSFPTLSFT